MIVSRIFTEGQIEEFQVAWDIYNRIGFKLPNHLWNRLQYYPSDVSDVYGLLSPQEEEQFIGAAKVVDKFYSVSQLYVQKLREIIAGDAFIQKRETRENVEALTQSFYDINARREQEAMELRNMFK